MKLARVKEVLLSFMVLVVRDACADREDEAVDLATDDGAQRFLEL